MVKVLLDENVPLPLKDFLLGHEVTTVQSMGWAGVTNGDLIAQAEGQFDVFILADKNLRYQQNLAVRKIALIELPTNRWPALQSLKDAILSAVVVAQPGSYQVLA